AGEDDRLFGCEIKELAGVVVKPGQGNPGVLIRRRWHGGISSWPQNSNYCQNSKISVVTFAALAAHLCRQQLRQQWDEARINRKAQCPCEAAGSSD
ncbi:MAG: hypothetical protein ACOY4P_11480, partial [Pseudomonadota bacterium]